MNLFGKRKIQFISVILLMLPILTVSSLQAFGYLGNTHPTFTTNESDIFIENFTDQVFKDPTTDAEGWGTGTVTSGRNFATRLLDFYPTLHPMTDLDVQGRKAYGVGFAMDDSHESVLAFNINNASEIRRTSFRNSLSGMISTTIEGDILYCGFIDSPFSGAHGIARYNVTNPYILNAGGVYIGSMNTNGPVTDIETQGSYVYYTSFNDSADQSFRIMEVSDPASPGLIVPDWVNKNSLGLAINGHFAYIAASTDGLYILNITDKAHPVEVGHIPLPGNATDVQLDGGYAYVTIGTEGIASIDIRNPTNPILEYVFNTGGTARHMVLQGNTLFVADGQQGVEIFDVADPTHLTYVAQIALPYTWDVELYGGVLMVGTDDGMYSYEVAAAGGGITDFATHYYVNSFDALEAWDVKVIGDIAFVAGGFDGFYTLNVRDPKNPILLDHTPVVGGTGYRKLDVDGQYAVVVSDSDMALYDISNPANIKLLKTESGYILYDAFLDGELLYISWQGGGYACFNITSYLQFSFIYEIDEPHFGTNITSIYAQGYHVYAADNVGGLGLGLYILDQRNLYNQYVTGYHLQFAHNLDLVVDGDLTYQADTFWCSITNVSNPYIPVYEADIKDNANALFKSTAVDVFGQYVISGGPEAIYLVDTTLFTKFHSSQYNTTAGAFAVEVSGDFTYVATRDSLLILRHFESAADTFIAASRIAESTPIFTMPNGSISNATLAIDAWIPQDSGIVFYMTADGINWEQVTINTLHTFVNPGTELSWRAVFECESDRSVHLYLVEITFDFEYKSSIFSNPLWLGLIAGGGGLVLIIIIVVVAVSVSKRKKKIPSR